MKILLSHIAIVILGAGFMHDRIQDQMGGLAEFGVYTGFFLILWLSTALYHRRYFRQFYRVILLMLYFIKELWLSNLKVIYYVITPRLQFQPAILELELRLKSERAIVLLANLITLTPGTLTLEVSSDRSRLYFHTINVPQGDVKAAKEKIRNGFEKRILAIGL